MDFYQLNERYEMLSHLAAEGKLSQADFEAEAGKLRVQDDGGNIWSRAPRSGRWVMWDGKGWQAAVPPVFEPQTDAMASIPPIPDDLDALSADSPTADVELDGELVDISDEPPLEVQDSMAAVVPDRLPDPEPMPAPEALVGADSPAAVVPDVLPEPEPAPRAPVSSSPRIVSSKSGGGVVRGGSSKRKSSASSTKLRAAAESGAAVSSASAMSGAERMRAKARQRATARVQSTPIDSGPATLNEGAAVPPVASATADSGSNSGWFIKALLKVGLIWTAIIIVGTIIAIAAGMEEWYALTLGLCLAGFISLIVTLATKASAWEGTVEEIGTVTSTDEDGYTKTRRVAYVRLLSGKRKRVDLQRGWRVGTHLKKVKGENTPRILN